MLRAPTWKMSQYFSMSAIWLTSITSEITFRLCASAARRSICSPCSPRPWNAYGELRGLKAPPRRIFAPARLTAAALACTCSSVSAEQGPAITITSSPPIRTSSTLTTVSSGLKVRLARLYGSLMRSTSCTPSRMPISSGSILCAPTTPSTVRVTPDERWTSIPSSMRRAITASICASVARSFMTTTMSLLSNRRTEIFRVGTRLALGTARFVDDAFEDAHDGVARERTGEILRGLPHLLEHPLLAIRLVDGHAELVFQLADFHRARDADVQQAHQLVVDGVDAIPQVVDAQDFSQRTYSSTRVLRSRDAPSRAITSTSALATAAGSAHCATSRTGSGREMPNPRATGRSLTRRIRSTISRAPTASASRAPVTPRREIAYRKPLPSAAALRNRSSVVVGLRSRIVSIP